MAVDEPWHTFTDDQYFCGAGVLRLKVMQVLWSEPHPRGWLVVRGVEFNWRGEVLFWDRTVTIKVDALLDAGVSLVPSQG